jgi:hypothetical protein
MDFLQSVPRVVALHNAGVIQIPGVAPMPIAMPAQVGDLDVNILSRAIKFYEDNKPLFQLLFRFAQPLWERFTHPAQAVAVQPPPPPADPSDPPPRKEGPPDPGTPRTVAVLLARYFWCNRKNSPWTEGGGRQLLGVADFQKVITLEDGLQGGDRFTYDITPVDQFGRKFVTGDAANVLMRDIEYEVIGSDVAELQLQDPEGLGFDPTPTLFIPWEGGVVKPGYRGEAGIIAHWTDQNTGAQVHSNELPMLRITPWA